MYLKTNTKNHALLQLLLFCVSFYMPLITFGGYLLYFLGETEVTIRFTPVKISTSQMKIQVNVSQFGFEPFECEIVGSSTAGLTREVCYF